MSLRACAVALILWAGAAMAEPIDAAFGAWLADNGGPAAALAVVRDGTVTGFDHGLRAGDPVDLASLSKAITAVCAAEIEQQTNLDWGTTPDGMTVTLRDLMYHISGIAPDLTQGVPGLVTYRLKLPDRVVAARARVRETQQGTRGQFLYNNENYALIAELIARTGPVEETCRRIALDPAGAVGAASPRFGYALGWAGWAMPVTEYARFHHHWFNGARSAPHGALIWAQDGAFAYYGLGTFARHAGDDIVFSHSGALCLPDYEINTLVLTRVGVGTAVAAVKHCLDETALRDLQQRFDALLR